MECERPVFEIKAPKIEPGALHYKTQDVKYWVRSSEFRGGMGPVNNEWGKESSFLHLWPKTKGL